MFLTQAAIELRAPEDTLKGELGRVLLKLEELQDAAISKSLAPETPAHPAMTDEELASLRRRSSKLTLMPYSYYRLSSQSGCARAKRSCRAALRPAPSSTASWRIWPTHPLSRPPPEV